MASSLPDELITQMLEKYNEIVATNLREFGHLPVLLQTESR